ncbi:Nucleoporin NIC96 [Fusarium oxysporum f. sp. albedinis]|nr:Nucleoporin NIC96 [Fusarium oxysporum f. sp. albedinis]
MLTSSPSCIQLDRSVTVKSHLRNPFPVLLDLGGPERVPFVCRRVKLRWTRQIGRRLRNRPSQHIFNQTSRRKL